MPVDHQTKYQADSWTTARRVVVNVERHVGEHWLLLAESHLTRWLFGSMLQRIV